MRIVIYRSGALGDTLLTFPALHLLRRHWPDAHVTLICREDMHPLILANGLADRAFSHELAAWARLFDDGAASSELALKVFADADLALVWARDTEGAIASRLHALGVRKAQVIPPPPQAGSRQHVALQLLGALEPLGVAAPMSVAELSLLVSPLRWPQEAQGEAAVAWESVRASLAGPTPGALHPGSGGARKRWPAGYFASLIRQLGHDFAPILIAGPQDEEIVAQVSAEAGATPVIRDLSVAGLAAFLSECAVYLGNDSGVTHLAGMLGVPTIALFGPTDPTLWKPVGAHVVALRSPTGRMEDLSPESVIGAIRYMMRREAGE